MDRATLALAGDTDALVKTCCLHGRTERACLPEPPCDCLNVTLCNATCWANAGIAGKAMAPARTPASGILIKSRRRLIGYRLKIVDRMGDSGSTSPNWNDRVFSYFPN